MTWISLQRFGGSIAPERPVKYLQEENTGTNGRADQMMQAAGYGRTPLWLSLGLQGQSQGHTLMQVTTGRLFCSPGGHSQVIVL